MMLWFRGDRRLKPATHEICLRYLREYLFCVDLLLKRLFLSLLLLLAACASPFEQPVRVVPQGVHDQAADYKACREYAELYGVINLGPMLGASAANQPDRRRRKYLFMKCMEGKGYGF